MIIRICIALLILLHPAALSARTLLQVGDRVLVQLPGETAFEDPFDIDRTGRVILPEVGALTLAGMDQEAAEQKVRDQLSLVYRDLDQMRLVLVERRLPMTVLGYVDKPGSVDLPDKATVQMALQAAGGLSQGAQLDRLQLRRGANVISFDYKAYLDTGDESLVPSLRPLDTLFVPASPLTGNVQVEFDARTLTAAGDAAEDGAAVTVFGEVHRPGSFAYKDNASVIEMIMRAGGVTRYGGIEQIRVISAGNPFPFNMKEFLDTGDNGLLPPLNEGDLIFVPQRSEQVELGARTVYVMGEVFKPGAFETKDGAGFLDILANAGGPTRFAETRQVRILRADGSVEPFDLAGYTEGRVAAVPAISPGDAILVPEKTDMNEKSWLKISPDRAVKVLGAVVKPGRYEWSDEMSLLDLLAHAGGPLATADAAHLQVLSTNEAGRSVTRKFNLEDFLANGGRVNDIPKIKAGDVVTVPELPKDPNDNRSQWVRQSSERSIYILGQVKAPGRYAFDTKLNFLDILSAAQGPAVDADLHNIRITHRGREKADVTHLNLARYFETGDESLLPTVRPEDVIYIPSRQRQWTDQKKEDRIRVLGAIRSPGRYEFGDDMTILDLLAVAGGPTDSAMPERIVVVNNSRDEPHSRLFDLVAFAKSGDTTLLPVLRSGDTIYIPDQKQSHWYILSQGIRDAVQVLSLVRLVMGG